MKYIDVKQELHKKGFVFIPEWKPEKTIDILSSSLGEMVNISQFLGYEKVPTIQHLKPKNKTQSHKNQYSSEFGLDLFPFHTDLAHWLKPPKFIILRCVQGFDSVTTKLLPLNIISEHLSELNFRKAILKPRRGIRNCLLPLSFETDNKLGLRWDSLFLEPVNKSAKSIEKFILKPKIWDMAEDIKLINFGDTLVLNNHLNLHARSSVPQNCVSRKIERVYFN